jgi:flagellar biosynthesis/type III secretory pathway chaperone
MSEEKTNILTELIDKIKATIGPATKEVASAVRNNDETEARIYALKDGYHLFRDNRQKNLKERILIQQEVLSLNSFFAMLQAHKTPLTYIFMTESEMRASLHYAEGQTRGVAIDQEYISLRNHYTDIFDVLLSSLDRPMTGKQIYVLATKLASASSIEIDLNTLVAFNKLKISQETNILDEDFSKGFELTVKASGKNATGELVKLPNHMQFKFPAYKGFSSEAFVNLRISMEMAGSSPQFFISWDSQEKDMEEFRNQIREEILFVAKPYGCENVPLIDGLPVSSPDIFPDIQKLPI